ncbi:MAG TPA: hypothetical protein DDX98_03975 [Bacteroidales bacterium]|jgi:uncharacterized tellurite resistance protein B-like protein|nr:hypothetical protein [Bacteroidales bacterium]
MEESYKEKLSTLSALAQIITVDGKIEDKELELYLAVAKRLEVSTEDYTRIMSGNITFEPPEKFSKRVVLFHNLLLMAYADKHIDDLEIQFCYELGLKLGLNSAAVRDILEKMEEQPQVGIDPYRVDRVFKRYYN